MVSTTYGIKKGFEYGGFKLSAGLEFGIGYKKVLHYSITNGIVEPVDYKYIIVPIMLLPTASIQRGVWSLNMLHVPKIDVGAVYVINATLFLIGYEF